MAGNILNRVVITGLGAVTPVGNSITSTFTGLLSRKSGIRRLTPSDMEYLEGQKVQSAGTLDSWDRETWVKQTSVMKSVYHGLGLNTCWDALADAKWNPSNEEQYIRTGIMYGSSRSSSCDALPAQREVVKHGYAKLDRFLLTKLIPAMAVGSITIPKQICGFSNAYISGNATGINAIGDAYRTIGFGEADVIMAGSSEPDFDPVVFESLSRGGYGLNLEVDKNPQTASRPFDSKGNGWVFSIGGGAVVLEGLNHALKRGAKIYAEVIGYSILSEGGDESAEDGNGTLRAMKKALKGLKPDVVFADASGYKKWDIGEANAIQKLFGKDTHVAAIKGNIGHMSSASSSVNVAIATYAMSQGIIPPILNLDEPVNKNINYTLKEVNKNIDVAVINTVNFDGTAFGSIAIKKFQA